MEDVTLTFQPADPDTEIIGVLRKTFRVPVTDQDPVSMTVRDHRFRVKDLSVGGVSIETDGNFDVCCGQLLAPCVLSLADDRLSNLEMTVVHCTATLSGSVVLGLKWETLAPDEEEMLNKYLTRMKYKVLADNDRDVDKDLEKEKKPLI
jgi:predicted small metal-binding protein